MTKNGTILGVGEQQLEYPDLCNQRMLCAKVLVKVVHLVELRIKWFWYLKVCTYLAYSPTYFEYLRYIGTLLSNARPVSSTSAVHTLPYSSEGPPRRNNDLLCTNNVAPRTD